MKKSNSIIYFLPTFIFLCLSQFTLTAQKNTVLVKDANGTGQEKITVLIFEKKENTCTCFDGGCLMTIAFDFDITDKNGHATFNKKGDPAMKPSTTYYASIDAKCTKLQNEQQPCDNQANACKYSASYMEFKTDKNGKFDVVKFTK